MKCSLGISDFLEEISSLSYSIVFLYFFTLIPEEDFLFFSYLLLSYHHNCVITHTHPEPEVLECEVKCALGSITMNKASGGDGIPVELFQILKDDAVKVLHSIYQQIWKTQQRPQDRKRSVFIPIPKKDSAKECSNYHTTVLISHASSLEVKS